MRLKSRFGVIFLSTLLLFSYGKVGADPSPKAEQGVDVVLLQHEQQEQTAHDLESLKARLQQRQTAIITGDLVTAYTFFSPGTKALISYERFRRGVSRGVAEWRDAQLVELNCPEVDSCVASLQLTYAYMGQIEAMRGQEMTTLLQERWIYSDGTWWYLSIEQ